MAGPAKSSVDVVVVGGGVAGAFVSKSLQSHAQVVLIEPYAFLSFSVFFWKKSTILVFRIATSELFANFGLESREI